MKQRFFLFVLVLLAAAQAGAQANWSNTAFVHRSGQQVLDGQNNPLRLNGVNLGGWLMWEGWIWGGGFTQEKTIYNNIQTVLGTPAADAFRDSVYANYITRDDIRKISQECFNVVRIPFNHVLLEDDFTPYVYKPEGWAVLDSVLKWCEDYNVYAILDMHSAPGGQSYGFTADPDFLITLWNGNINKTRTKRLWKAIADRYKNRGIIAGYDLLNEPDVSSDSTMLAMYNDIIDSVRLVDTNHMFFIEGNSYASDFSMFTTTLPDPNTCFQFHFYTWFISNAIASNLASYTALSDSLNAPFWCGEWGENDTVQLDTTLKLLNDPAYKICGSAFWTWKKMKDASNYPYYTGVDTTLEWNKSIDWICNTNNPQPTVAEMQTGIAGFIQNMKQPNCTFSTSLSGILNACVPAGIPVEAGETAVQVFPNPFSGQLSIANWPAGAQAELYNASGQRVYAGSRPDGQDFSALPAGLYLLKIAAGGRSGVVKLVKE